MLQWCLEMKSSSVYFLGSGLQIQHSALQLLSGCQGFCQGTKVFFYLNNHKIILAWSPEPAMFHTAQLILHLTRLEREAVLPTAHKAGASLGSRANCKSRCTTMTALTLMHLLGLLAEAHSVVLSGLLHMRWMQICSQHRGLDPKRRMCHSLTISQAGSQVGSTGRVDNYASMFTDRLLMERDWSCMTVLPFSPKTLNSPIIKGYNLCYICIKSFRSFVFWFSTKHLGWQAHTVLH